MAQTDPRETAKIYDLTAFRRARAAQPATIAAKPERASSSGGAWYHEAAIRDEDRGRRT